MKFYPADWRAEPSLRAVSLAARGLWIEMLCLMHEAEPRGHLLLNGRPVKDSQLSALAGVPLDQTQELLVELEGAGTFSRTRAGVIYSRRMRHDSATSEKQRANVEKRWSKERFSTPSQYAENTTENHTRNTNFDTNSIPKKPEARSQKTRSTSNGCEPAGFEKWWEFYPKKTAKGTARRAYSAALKKTSAEVLLASITAYPWPTEMRFVPHPTTWLNGERWDDDTATRAPSVADDIDPWRQRLLNWRINAYWNSDWGPKPGKPGYLGPDEAQARAA